MRRLYGSHGYIDFTATPFTEIDDSTHQVSIRMDLDQQTQYRIGGIDVSGLDPNLASLLESKVKPGDIFNVEIIQNFLDDHRSAFPPLVSHEEIVLRRNANLGTVDLRFGIQHPLVPDN